MSDPGEAARAKAMQELAELTGELGLYGTVYEDADAAGEPRLVRRDPG